MMYLKGKIKGNKLNSIGQRDIAESFNDMILGIFSITKVRSRMREGED